MCVKIFIFALLLIGGSSGQDLNDLINSIFNTSAGTPKPRQPDDSLIINPVPTPLTTSAPIPITTSTNPPRVVTTPPPGTASHSYQPCGLGKECVRNYLCSGGKINTDGATLIDIRIDDATCPFLETCCATSDKVDTPIVRPVDNPKGCGYRNLDGVGFKIEGAANNESEFGEFPWMVAILREETALDKILNVYQCGGSLITPQVVLTGAHCVQSRPANVFKVRAGEWETNSKTELYPDQDRKVLEIVVHDHFNKGSLYNDVALLFLDAPFELAPNVNTVCLPPANAKFDNARCIATGWGKDQFENGKYQNILKKIDLPVVPNPQCQNYLRQTRLGNRFELHSSFLCAGGERGKDTCKGDGGSPLVCPIAGTENRYYQAGIVAWGIGCGTENVPGVYGNVPQLRSWIDEQLAYKHIDSKPFTP